MSLMELVNNIKKQLVQKNSKIALLMRKDIELVIIEEESGHPFIICRGCETNKNIAKVNYDPYNKFFYTINAVDKIKNVMFPFEEGEEEVVKYFQQAISEEYDLNYEEDCERNRILSKLSDFASLLKEERNKEKQKLEDLGPIKWVSEEELVASEIMDIPIKKETNTYVRLGYLENNNKYVLKESVKTYMNKELMDVSQNVFEFHIDSVDIILKLLKQVLGKTIRLT